MSRLIKQISRKKGLPPGTPVYIGDERTEEVKITIIDYGADRFEMRTAETVEECLEYKDKPGMTWINVEGIHDTHIVEKLGASFGLHPLIVEDIVNTGQRPKVDISDDYIFIVMKRITWDQTDKVIQVEQISLILGSNFLITFEERDGETFSAVINRIKSNKGRIRKSGADYLAYSLMDNIVDNYFKVIENIGEDIEEMEEELVDNPTPETVHKIHFIKREMIFLRKAIWPLREIISLLEREETRLIQETSLIYLKDLYDHTIQMIDIIETYADITSGMLDVYLSSISNKMNAIMKVLTIIATIFIPLTFIVGLYGMNFNTAKSPYNMPELNWYYGYPFVLGLMAAITFIMLLIFKKKKWF
jgi:magnesium transporter